MPRRIWDRWVASGETRVVTWKWVRRSIALGLCSIGLIVASTLSIAFRLREDAQTEARQTCLRSVEARQELREVLLAMYASFNGIVDVVEEAGANTALVDELQSQVNVILPLIDRYEPRSTAECL